MIQVFDQHLRSRHVPAERADRLRQRPHLDVDPAVHAEMVDGAASVLPEYAARVRIVDHHDAAELLGERAQLRERADVAVHAEYTVADEQLPLGDRQRLQDPSGGLGVLMRKHFDDRLAQPAAIDDAGVVELVRDDNVVLC